MNYFTHHGFEFAIDTADWGQNSDSASKAADKLEAWLRKHDAAQTANIHAALTEFANGDLDAGDDYLQTVFDAGNAAVLEVWNEESWASHPDTGHNCELLAA